MKKLFSTKLWFVLSVVFASLLVVMIVGNIVVENYRPLLHANLFTAPYELVGEAGDDPSAEYFAKKFNTVEEYQAYAKKTSYDLEAEGLTLLENKEITAGAKALPLPANAKVSLFGTGSVYHNCSVQGASNYDKDNANLPSLKDALEDAGASVNGKLWDIIKGKVTSGEYGRKDFNHVRFIKEAPWDLYSSAANFASFGDAAIMVISRDSTEGSDASASGSDGANGDYLALSPEEKAILVNLTNLKQSGTFSRVIVLLNSAMPNQCDFMKDDDISVDALMWIGNTGMSGINAVADALMGKINPSGRVSDTFVYDDFSSPVMASWAKNPGKAFARSWNDSSLNVTQKYYGVYVEGVYVGYRYYETRYADKILGTNNVGSFNYDDVVAYTFGTGLSYTEFQYSSFSVTENAEDKTFTVRVTVRNTGSVKGKEVVQIYLQKPYTEYDKRLKIEVPAIELAGFAKTGELLPGGEETVTITVEKQDFAVYDAYGYETYIMDVGQHYLAVGKNAHDALNNVLKAQGKNVPGNAALASVAFNQPGTAPDYTTYAVSSENGEEITNRLSDMDLNTYAGSDTVIDYVSRSNWNATFPTEACDVKLTEQMKKDLANKTEPKSEGEMPTYGASNGLLLINLRGKDYKDPDWEKLLDQTTFEEQNVLLTTGYCITAAVTSVVKPQTKGQDGPTYCKESTQWGCRFPNAGLWAASFNIELLANLGSALACETRLNNYHEMWCPGINMHRSPYSGRNHEYSSEDPYLTGKCAESQIKAMQEQGVISYPKHFVLNDQECNRNGVCIWLNEQACREIYLRPWKYACSPKRGAARGIMSSFNRTGCTWSSGHAGLVDGILRGEFGWNGINLTDMAESNGTIYMTVLNGVFGGTDIWFSSGSSHTFRGFESNATIARKMRELTHRVLYNVCNYSAAMNGISSETKLVRIYAWWEILITFVLVLFIVLTAGCVVMLTLSWIRKFKEIK